MIGGKHVRTFGRNNYGQRGADPNGVIYNELAGFVMESNTSQVAAGFYNSYYLLQNGSLWGVGRNASGQIGDGTTTVCILAGALLAEADPLLSQQIHPQTIIEGWRLALKAARTALEVIRVLPTSRARTRPCTARCPQYRLAPPRARPCRKGRDVSN